MPGATVVKALFDYSRKHTDELSFRKGDVIIVSQQIDGGWWEGVLNGTVGWFPSNYVSPMQTSDNGIFSSTSDSHLHAFQNEIVQHILEGEARQVNELNQLNSQIILNLEPFYHLPFVSKLSRMRDLVRQATAMHQKLAYSLNEMRQSSEAKRVGKLFLEMASTVNSIGCDYSKIHLYVIIGIEKYCDAISRHLSGKCGITFQLDRCKQQLSVVFDRLGRYPLLLKEMERYLEVSHPDREDIRQAIHVYGEITERCAILRKFKEYDIDILLSMINGWQGKSIDKLGDPILTLYVGLLNIEYDRGESRAGMEEQSGCSATTSGRLSVIIIFPNSVLLLARTKKQNVYEFTTKIPVNCLKVISSLDNEKYLDLIISSMPTAEVDCRQPSRVSLDCNDENARDLLVSTLNDLIQYQTQLDRASLVGTSASSTSAPIGDAGAREGQGPEKLKHGCDRGTPPAPVSAGEVKKPSRSDDKPQPSGAAAAIMTPTSGGDRPGTAPAAREVDKQQHHHHQAPCILSPGGVAAEAADNQKGLSDVAGRTVAQLRLGSQSEHLLPHRIQTGALIRWPWEDASGSGDSGRMEDASQLPVNALRCLRLDGPNDVPPTGGIDGRLPLPVAAPDRAPGGEHVPTVSPPGAGRPGSPRAGGEPPAVTSREIRRKRSDRQKSAVNPDEILRSVGRLHEIERRNADATKILQVVEAYCASAWSQHGFHVGDRNHSNFCVPLSPTESRTLRQQFISSQPHRSEKAEQPAKRPLSERLPGDSFPLAGGQKSTANPTNVPSRSSLVSSASAIVRQVAKRSGSKSKADSAPSTSPNSQPPAGVQLVSSSSRLVAAPSSHSSTNPGSQALLPPPVILPTRGGRRRI